MSFNTEVYDFNKQMIDGDAGENIFYTKFQEELLKGATKEPDFIIKSTQELLELKTDTWKLSDLFDSKSRLTPNLFMEYYSDKARRTIGGPWRSQIENCKYFVYFFVNNNVFYLFETQPLVQLLDHLIKGMSLKDISNKGWTTAGYPINKNKLEQIALICNMEENKKLSELTMLLETKLEKLDIK